jgi:addiction module RelE/StbE family toxin
MKLVFSDNAKVDLNEIYLFIGKDSKRGATFIHNRILDAIERLAQFPEMAPLEPLLESSHQNYRSLTVKRNYKVVYRVDGETVYISAVWDCRMSPAKQRGGSLKRK